MCLYCNNLTPGRDCATVKINAKREKSVADPGEALSLKLCNFFKKFGILYCFQLKYLESQQLALCIKHLFYFILKKIPTKRDTVIR